MKTTGASDDRERGTMDRRGGAAAASRALALEMKTFLVTVEVFDGKELVVLKTLLLLFPLGYSKREKGEGGGGLHWCCGSLETCFV